MYMSDGPKAFVFVGESPRKQMEIKHRDRTKGNWLIPQIYVSLTFLRAIIIICGACASSLTAALAQSGFNAYIY